MLSPAEAIARDQRAGYSILALTDHDRCTWPWAAHGQPPTETGLLAIPGNELSHHHHLLSLFCDFAPAAYSLEEAVSAIGEREGLAVACHPSLEWPSMGFAPGLQIPLSPPLRDMTLGDFTIETWFCTENSGRSILTGNYSPYLAGALNLELHHHNAIRVYLKPSSGNPVDLSVYAGPLGINTRDGAWHHLAAVRRGTELALYLDGQLAGESEWSHGCLRRPTDGQERSESGGPSSSSSAKATADKEDRPSTGSRQGRPRGHPGRHGGRPSGNPFVSGIVVHSCSSVIQRAVVSPPARSGIQPTDGPPGGSIRTTKSMGQPSSRLATIR